MSSRLFYSQFFGVLLIVLLLLLAVPFYMKSIPKVLSKRVEDRLVSNDLNWSVVDVEGRDITLSGVAPSIESHHKAVQLAGEVLGVRDVHDEISPRVIMPYTLDISLKKKEIKVEGFLPTKEAKNQLLGVIKKTYLAREVIEQIDIGTGNPKSWMELISKLTVGLKALDAASINIVDEEVSISGKIKTEKQKKLFEASLKSFENNPYKIDTRIVAMDTPILVCQKKFDQLLKSQKVKFASNKSIVASQSNKLIKELAYVSSLCPRANIEIVGHTDSLGDDKKNRELSLERAKAVVSKLFQEGVSLDRMKAFGKGEALPIADNKTPEGREKNRRIEFKVIIKEER